jgi:hypothetical protein
MRTGLGKLGANNVSNPRAWFALITSCAVPALAVALGSAVLFTSAAVGFASDEGSITVEAATQVASDIRQRIFTGLITDDHCRARHDMDSGKSTKECTKMCVRNGSKYVLVEGDKKYDLAGSEAEFDDLAGERVRVVGSLDGNTIKVDSISTGQETR